MTLGDSVGDSERVRREIEHGEEVLRKEATKVTTLPPVSSPPRTPSPVPPATPASAPVTTQESVDGPDSDEGLDRNSVTEAAAATAAAAGSLKESVDLISSALMIVLNRLERIPKVALLCFVPLIVGLAWIGIRQDGALREQEQLAKQLEQDRESMKTLYTELLSVKDDMSKGLATLGKKVEDKPAVDIVQGSKPGEVQLRVSRPVTAPVAPPVKGAKPAPAPVATSATASEQVTVPITLSPERAEKVLILKEPEKPAAVP